MLLSNITQLLENLAPLNLQESYDNSGLLIGEPDMEIDRALISLDLTEVVVEEAIKKNCNLIISHHPIIFKGLKKITGKTPEERIIKKVIQNQIAVYAIHTNLDNVDAGVNAALSQKLGLTNTRILSPVKETLRKLVTFCPLKDADKVRNALFVAGAGHIGNYDSCSFNSSGAGTFRGDDNSNPFVGEKGKLHFEDEVRIETIFPMHLEKKIINALISAHPYEEVAYDIYFLGNEYSKNGAGMIGELPSDLGEVDFLKRVKEILGTSFIRHSDFTGKKIKKIAVCGGSGSFLINKAISAGADAFITGDVKYHDFFLADKKLLIVDAGHYETEQFAKDLIYSYLIENFSNFAVQISEVNTNSVNYL